MALIERWFFLQTSRQILSESYAELTPALAQLGVNIEPYVEYEAAKLKGITFGLRAYFHRSLILAVKSPRYSLDDYG